VEIAYIKSKNFGTSINVFTKNLMANLLSGSELLAEDDGKLAIEVRDKKTLKSLLLETYHGDIESQEELSKILIRAEIHNLMIRITDEGAHKLKIQVIEKGTWEYLLDKTFPGDDN